MDDDNLKILKQDSLEISQLSWASKFVQPEKSISLSFSNFQKSSGIFSRGVRSIFSIFKLLKPLTDSGSCVIPVFERSISSSCVSSPMERGSSHNFLQFLRESLSRFGGKSKDFGCQLVAPSRARLFEFRQVANWEYVLQLFTVTSTKYFKVLQRIILDMNFFDVSSVNQKFRQRFLAAQS